MIPEESIKNVEGHQQRSVIPSFAGSVVSGLVGGAIDMARDWNAQGNASIAADQSWRRSSASSAAATAASRSMQHEQERYNSVEEYVRQLRSAGLSPALAYGTLSPGSVSGGSGTSAQAPVAEVPYTSGVGSSMFSNISTSLLQSAQARNLDVNSDSQAQDVITKSVENDFVRSKTQLTVLEQIAKINKMLSEKSLNDEQRTNLSEMRESMQNYYNSLAESSKSSAALSDERVNTEKTIQNLNSAKTGAVESEISLNKAKTKLADSQVVTEQTKQELNKASTVLNNVTWKDLAMKLHFDKKQMESIANYVSEHDLPSGSEKIIALAAEEFFRSSGKSIPENLASWLNAGNWLGFIKDLYRTSKWSKSENGSDEQPNPGSKEDKGRPSSDLPRNDGKVSFPPPPATMAKTVPSNYEMNNRIRAVWPSLSDVQRSRYKELSSNYNRLSDEYKSKMKMDFYYAKNIREFNDYLDKWINLIRN